jgi:hypothetical protein
MSGTTSEETFEWIETPPAPSVISSDFDCGVKTTAVCSCSAMALRKQRQPLTLHLWTNSTDRRSPTVPYDS